MHVADANDDGVRRQAIDGVISACWRRGDSLAGMAVGLGPHVPVQARHVHRWIMDRVRALSLPDRHPTTRFIMDGRAVEP